MRLAGLIVATVIVAVWAVFRLGPVTTANAEAAVNRPIARLQEVRSVALDGRRVLSARLREVIGTRAGAQLDADQLGRDRDAMERALADLGYLGARVEPAKVTFDTAGAAYVTFAVDQGPMFHLRKIEITGAGKDAATIIAHLRPTSATGPTAWRPSSPRPPRRRSRPSGRLRLSPGASRW